ncbi:MAG: carboxypeptidase-like regulatory domain-containing protein [Phycisphaerae bacterium]|nr:carboxypeptidase-like regulatory domain-containing protein [Saprospiraceae bacterium]
MKNITISLLALLCFSPIFLSAQTGIIAGKIIDAKSADPLIGVSVKLDEGVGGAITDFDGNFRIANVPLGKHKISLNYTGYTGKNLEDVDVKSNEATTVDASMEESAGESLAEVVVVAKAKRESTSALTIFQKNSVSMADGISSETIKRTPDRTTGDVIRRVSGATIQDNKFAIIRGLNDRYNVAMLNGALLSSTEPDRKAFSFDLFPSAMLDNLVIVKTASPDLPGEFAGGAILVSTKDIPEASFIQASLSGGYNTVTTSKPFQSSEGGGSDWLGHDDGTRALPATLPSSADFKAQPKEEKYRTSQLFPNDWAINEESSARPNIGVQLSGGYIKDISEKVQFGLTLGGSYSNNNRLQNGSRADYEVSGKVFDFNDKQFKNNVLWGTLFNTALKINNTQKIGLQATYSTNTDNIISDRSGYDYAEVRKIKSTAIEYTENHLLTTRLYGEHQLTQKGMRLNWGGGLNRTSRDVPSLRRMFYAINFDDTLDVNFPYQAYVPFGSADPYRSGRFYSSLEEDTYNGNIDLSIPFHLGKQKQSIKLGGLYQKRDRKFDARVMGYILGNFIQFDYDLLKLPQNQIFDQQNIGEKGFIMDEITNPSDGYTGQSNLVAGYAMLDNKIADRLRIAWGARVESFRQQVQSAQYGGTPISVDTTISALLPSFNMTYSLNQKHQLRLSGSKTVCRAEFRELAPFSFFDFYLNANVVGNPALTQGSIYNADIRYEIYPGQNQLFSVSLFYKRFKNPIEFTFAAVGGGTRTFSFNNVASANNYGAEMELRKNFDFVGVEDLVFFSNVSLIRSNIDLSKGVSYFDSTRALQGQSPYILNAGLTYNITRIGLSTTLIYNVIGDRIAQVGTVSYGDIYERHRNLLDFSVSKKLGRNGEVKLTWGDILRPEFIYYQDNNASHKYEEAEDNVMQRLTLGSTITLSLGYKF